MTVYSLYVFDRHCTCTFYSNFSGRHPRPGPSTLPNVYRASIASSSNNSTTNSLNLSTASALPPWERTAEELNAASGGVVGGQGGVMGQPTLGGAAGGGGGAGEGKEKEENKGLAFDEEAKLVYGIVFSLRNMVRKLGGKDEGTFHSYSTSSYKLHYFISPSNTHFILLTSPMSESLRFLLRQIYTGPFTEYVVRNPMVEMDSNEELDEEGKKTGRGGKGWDNEKFREGVEKLVGGL